MIGIPKIPNDKELEEIVIGALISSNDCYIDIQEHFFKDLFFKEELYIIAESILHLKSQDKSTDLVSVSEDLKSKNKLKRIGGDYYLVKITNKGCVYIGDNLIEKVLLLNQYYIRRKFIESNNKLTGDCYDDSVDVFDLIGQQESNLNEIINNIQISKTASAIDCHVELIEHIDRIANAKESLTGVNTGFNEINELTAGWQKTDLIILAGATGMGKTSFMLNTAKAALNENKTVLVFSLEMSRLQLYARMCSQKTSIPLNKFLKEKMDPTERAIFNKETIELSNSRLFVEDIGNFNLNFIKTKSRKLKREKSVDLIVIDYLQMIRREKSNKSTTDEISVITGSLKMLAKELNIPIICLSQLSREVNKNSDKRPELFHLRDSGSIEQDADMVLFVYRPEYYGIMADSDNNPTIGMAEIIIAKHRNGGLNDIVVGFDGRCTNFYDLKREITNVEPTPIALPQAETYESKIKSLPNNEGFLNEKAKDDQPF